LPLSGQKQRFTSGNVWTSIQKNLEEKILEATEEIRRKSNFQRLLIRSSNDAIVAFDHDWKIVVYNPEAARIFGEKTIDVKNIMTIQDLYTPKIAKIFKAEVKNYPIPMI